MSERGVKDRRELFATFRGQDGAAKNRIEEIAQEICRAARG